MIFNEEKIPEELISLSKSAEIFDVSEKIGGKLGLHIDQIGELDANIREILRGKSKSEDFVENLIKSLEIDEQLANKIAQEANIELFDAIKSKFKINQTRDKDQLPLETRTASDLIPIKKPNSRPAIYNENLHTDPLIDHLLTTPVAMETQKVQISDLKDASTKANAGTIQSVPKKNYTTDPYREQTN